MLNLNGANRLYTDIELMERAADRFKGHDLDEGPIYLKLLLVANILDIEPDVLRGFITERNKEGVR